MARYSNFIIENKVNDYLTTKLGLSQFMTVDNELAQTAGMIKKVHKYTKSGSAETVTEGNGNAAALAITYTPVTHTVATTQAKFAYSDEAEMEDPYYVDKGIEAIAESIINSFNAAAITQFLTTTNKVKTGSATTDPTFNNFADAIALLNAEDNDEAGFFALVNPDMKARLRKSLAGDLKYCEAFARTGYIGSICGIPVYTSKAVTNKKVIIANKEAVTAFVKKSTEVETDRNIDTRTNTVIGRMVNVVALTDESKCVQISMEA